MCHSYSLHLHFITAFPQEEINVLSYRVMARKKNSTPVFLKTEAQWENTINFLTLSLFVFDIFFVYMKVSAYNNSSLEENPWPVLPISFLDIIIIKIMTLPLSILVGAQ